MRVLIANRHLAVVGGAETYLRAVLPRLAAEGFEIGVLADDPDPSGGILAGVSNARIWLTGGRRPDAILAEIDRWKPDVVYSHGLADPIVEVALANQYPCVFFAHGYQGTCVSGTKCHTRPAVRACSRRLGPACLALYLPRGCGGRSPVTMLGLYREQRRRLAAVTHCRAVLTASRHILDEYRANGISPNRLRLVPLFPPATAPDLGPPAPRMRSDRVLFVGRLTRLKGLPHLAAAVAAAGSELGRRLTLVVAGDGPDRADAEAATRHYGVAAEFLGWVGADRCEAEMRAADVLGVPSLWPEPFGLVGLEAGSVGLPAAGYATGGIPDWLIPGVSGESAPGDHPDPRELAAALVRVLADEDHWQQLREGAWRVATTFTPERHTANLTAVLGDVAAGLPLPPSTPLTVQPAG